MSMQTLVRHADIQNWVNARHGHPAIRMLRDGTGSTARKLTLSFAVGHAAPVGMPGLDDGMSPVSWSAWLAELDRQHLALRVTGESPPSYEFIPRRELN